MLIANITVLVVGAQAYLGAAIGQALHDQPTIKLVITEDYAEAEKQTAQLYPQIIWLQMNMGHSDGMAEIRRLKQLSPASRLIVLVAEEDEQEAFAALMAGAQGYCSTQQLEPDAILSSIQLLCRDTFVLPPALRVRLLQRLRATALWP